MLTTTTLEPYETAGALVETADKRSCVTRGGKPRGRLRDLKWRVDVRFGYARAALNSGEEKITNIFTISSGRFGSVWRWKRATTSRPCRRQDCVRCARVRLCPERCARHVDGRRTAETGRPGSSSTPTTRRPRRGSTVVGRWRNDRKPVIGGHLEQCDKSFPTAFSFVSQLNRLTVRTVDHVVFAVLRRRGREWKSPERNRRRRWRRQHVWARRKTKRNRRVTPPALSPFVATAVYGAKYR